MVERLKYGEKNCDKDCLVCKAFEEHEKQRSCLKMVKVWCSKENLEWFKEMQQEGRTRHLIVSSFRKFDNDSEIEIEIKE